MHANSHLYRVTATCALELTDAYIDTPLVFTDGADWIQDLAKIRAWHDAELRGEQPTYGSMRAMLELSVNRINDGIQSFTIRIAGAFEAEKLVDFLLAELPAYGPEIVWALANGCRDICFDREVEADTSYASLLGRAQLTAHQRLGLRHAAIAGIRKTYTGFFSLDALFESFSPPVVAA